MKRLIGLTTSAALAFGIMAAPGPAAAGDDDLAKILGGLLVLGVTAKVIDDRRDKRAAKRAEAARIGGHDVNDQYQGSRIISGRLLDPSERRQPKAKRGYKRHALPQQCLRRLETTQRDRSVYGLRCLSRNFRPVAKLPDHCAFRVQTPRGVRTVFGARCLRHDGWKVAGLH